MNAPTPKIPKHMLDLIASCTPEGSGFRAPQAKHPTEKLPPIEIHPNAMHAGWDFEAQQGSPEATARRKQRAYERAKERRALGIVPNNERAKNVPLSYQEEVYELVRIEGPIPWDEALTRMQRCGYPREVTARALVVLEAGERITAKVWRAKRGDEAITLYEVRT